MSGHKAIVARISKVESIPNADRIHVATVLGEKVVVSKDWGEGYVGVLFPVDVQLSEEFCYTNNLNRNSELNSDQTKKGFFESNRRVRAQPFLKVKSEGLFVGIESFEFTGDTSLLTEGFTFDELNGVKLCEKYFSPETKNKKEQNQKLKVKVNRTPFFEKHVDSDQFKHYADNIPVGSILYFHAKVHGTSARITNTLVESEIKGVWNKVKAWLNHNREFVKCEWKNVVGTRNVVLTSPEKEGFHGSEQFRFDVADTVFPFLEKGMTVYGEIAGFANGKSIMPSHDVAALKDKSYIKKYGEKVTYSYNCKEHEHRFHIYRVTHLSHDGKNIDMSQRQMEQWCADRGLLTTLEVHPPMIYDGDVQKLRELVEELTERPDVLTEDYIDPSHVSEGIIIRVEGTGFTPKFYKSKSYAFRVLEGICKEVDVEDAS